MNIICEDGVFMEVGFDIDGINQNRIYNVLRDSDFQDQVFSGLVGSNIPVYQGDCDKKNIIGFANNFKIKDSVIYIEQEELSKLNLSATFDADVFLESGVYGGVNYDIKLKNPEILFLSVVEQKKEKIQPDS